ncbi:hypothetical protein [Streptomyces halstedii]|uniref:Uncharacterized protein n=1 Tax=Streptomyces halstedii TaxID=1944 RepID=A0A6N9TZP1_STRHA|nr:hypothetical protein [Streptomyces halstedii]NEA15293.1 hypothetical protein [Streptomyces halstedii]
MTFDLTGLPEPRSSSGEDGPVLDASTYTERHRTCRETMAFLREHFEAMVFRHLAEESRTGGIALIGSEEYADWNKRLLSWLVVEDKPPAYLVGWPARGSRKPVRASSGPASPWAHCPNGLPTVREQPLTRTASARYPGQVPDLLSERPTPHAYARAWQVA